MTCRNSATETKPFAILVETVERLLHSLLRVYRARLSRHHLKKLGNVDRPIAIRIDLVDHVLCYNSDSVRVCPTERMAILSTEVVILPSPPVMGFSGLAIDGDRTCEEGEP